MAELIPDDFDFAAYMRQTDASAKVRKASQFGDELLNRFRTQDDREASPSMISTKLRDRIEFRPGEITAWVGYSGHRKSMFTGQVALDLCRQRQRVLMASFEMAPGDTLARMARQSFAVSRPAPSSLQQFARWTDGRLWLFDHMGRIGPDQCMAVVRYFAEELRGTQVLIDSMMMVCKSEEHLDEQKQFATDVVRAAQEFGVHIHLVAHCRKPQAGEEKPPTKYDLRGSAAISDQAHNVITVWSNKAKQRALEVDPHDQKARAEPDARVCVEKQRNGSFEGAVKLWFNESCLRFSDSRTAPDEPYVLE
ncbi:MAG: AAA family ATPase [Burkholderiales bacterium]|nr:AAA family ATPase [Burkholderiales bacterium]